ncbi:MAG: Lrp/AsnC family transcriptional regulator [Verrucomicrobiota bacterium]
MKNFIHRKILAIAEDRLMGFQEDPIAEIARKTRLNSSVVIQSIQEMMRAGVIRRVRQTLATHHLTEGALIAWEIPETKLRRAFELLSKKDSATGHVVIRSSERDDVFKKFRLWTTLKSPHDLSLKCHADFLKKRIGAKQYFLLPARGIFVLSVGHIRRANMALDSKSPHPVRMQMPKKIRLSRREWKILEIIQREFQPEEIQKNLWQKRAEKKGIAWDFFLKQARNLEKKDVFGKFSVFLNPARVLGKKTASALFVWSIPNGWEEKAGRKIGRFQKFTHCYWRAAHEGLLHINLMGIAHGENKAELKKLKNIVDAHLLKKKIPCAYSNLLWSERSAIKPSEWRQYKKVRVVNSSPCRIQGRAKRDLRRG